MVNGGESTEPTIEIGDHTHWIELYQSQAELDATMNAVKQRMEELVPKMDEVATIAKTGVELEDVEGMQALQTEAGPFVDMIQRVSDEGRQAHQASIKHNAQVSFEEWELGSKLKDVEPEPYVTRAIGQRNEAIEKRWDQARAEIEIFRQITGEVRSDRTLGNGLKTQWSRHHLARLFSNILNVQVAQVALSEDPEATAREFGIEEVIVRDGPPPKYEPADVARMLDFAPTPSWMGLALETVHQIGTTKQAALIYGVEEF